MRSMGKYVVSSDHSVNSCATAGDIEGVSSMCMLLLASTAYNFRDAGGLVAYLWKSGPLHFT